MIKEVTKEKITRCIIRSDFYKDAMPSIEDEPFLVEEMLPQIVAKVRFYNSYQKPNITYVLIPKDQIEEQYPKGLSQVYM